MGAERRLDLRWARPDFARDAPFARAAFAGLDAAWQSDRGYRTADFAHEQLAVVVRDGLRDHLPSDATPYLAAALVEGFDGNPLGTTADPAASPTATAAPVASPTAATTPGASR